MRVTLACLLLISLVAGSFATTGIDISSLLSVGTYQCIAGQGHGGFAIPRVRPMWAELQNACSGYITLVYQSNGRVDPYGALNVHNAQAAGYPHVDGYIFPCPTCGNGGGQVAAAINALNADGAIIGMLWFDIEGPQYWMDQASNRAFFMSMYNEAKALNLNFGVYSSASQWNPIFGNWAGAPDVPLWYPHYDNNPSFSDFSPFGGWTKPAMKQYIGDANICGADVDLTWYP